jgi:hypothetical protein
MLSSLNHLISLSVVLPSAIGRRCAVSCEHSAGDNSLLRQMAHGNSRQNYAAILSGSTSIIC